MEHYPSIIRKTPLLLVITCTFSWIWATTAATRKVVWPEALRNILASNRPWRTSNTFLYYTLYRMLPNRWSMIVLEIWGKWHANIDMSWVNFVARILGGCWEMINTCTSFFDRFILFEASIGWLHQSLWCNFSILRMTLPYKYALGYYLALLLINLNFCRASCCWTSWLEWVTPALA